MKARFRHSSFVILLLLAGCAAPDRFAQPDASWQTRVGQAKYVSRKRRLVGEVTVTTRGEKDFVLDFRKGPGLPLLTIRGDGRSTRYEGVLAHGSHRVWERARAVLARDSAASVHVAAEGATVDFRFAW